MNGDDDILKELKEQSRWLRFLAFSSLKKVLESNLETKEQKMIYDLSNGENSTTEISKKLKLKGIKISHMTVYNYWKKWNSLGIVEPSERYSGRCRKIVNLEDFDIK